MSDFYKEPQSSDSFQERNDYNAPFNQPPVVPPTNGKSVASMVLGILNLLLIFMPYVSVILGILAIILSAISFKEIRRHGENGKGMAVAGLVCGIVGTVFGLIIFAIVIIVIVAESSSNSF
ncbi:DUF4190 domain-containing protein [Paenibacillus peoriae]|uniref:DUF4190 domain-containing protein n=1 Tax=Paenibacillus peoriae TaxID=59893 RepID=UPI00026C579A|nr:DUF4190 domain-containing protein [Paenibacillus peoriae]MEC0182992.1 DUF4190 domain-containing protein [Paenibacillus peoriae]